MADSTKPTLDELRERVRASYAFYGGSLPPEASLAWGGYFAALIEWGLISVSDHAALVDMLPRGATQHTNNDPVMHILLGWEKLTHSPEA
jgi:hypothetical protein